MKTDFPYKDRDPEIHQFQVALRMSGLDVPYQSASLIWQVVKQFEEKGADIAIRDIIAVQLAEEQKFSEYYQQKEKE